MTYSLTNGTPDALVIHCADPRFQEAFRAFIREQLGIRMPMIIALPGVTSHFGMQAALPKNWNAMRSYLRTMTERHAVGRVVLINHDDCKGYAKIADHFGGLARVSDAQRKHLIGLSEFVRKEYLPNASFELYQAHIVGDADEREVEFEKIG
jgi:hypothetical protein